MNSNIIHILSELGKNEKLQCEHFKASAYFKAINSIKTLNKEITSINDINGIKGIGKKITLKIQEILETGHLQKYDTENKDELLTTLKLLSSVQGIGPAKAHELAVDHNIKTLEELELKGKHLLTNYQLIGLKYYTELAERIPCEEVKALKLKIKSFLKEMNIKINICGSFRRKMPTCGDIDVLITSKNEHNFDIDRLNVISNLNSILTDELGFGDTKYSGVCQLTPESKHRRIDIRFIPKDSLPFAKLYFTGSDNLNKQMRIEAIKLGLKLNEYGLFNNSGESIPCKNEKEIFQKLNMNYLKPCERNI
jgi:DNA polymerase/3'-5' exonuclease PolX